MPPSSKAKIKLGLLLGGLAVVSSLILFQLSRHPETAALLVALPGQTALSCTVRCVGIGPLLQVLGEGLKALLLIFLSGSFLYALFRMAQRTFRTWSFVDKARKRAIPAGDVPQITSADRVTVYEDRSRRRLRPASSGPRYSFPPEYWLFWTRTSSGLSSCTSFIIKNAWTP
jgi:hypothetical protein